MFKKILVANRGEIACRIFRTCKKLGIRTVALYSEADAGALHMRQADEAIALGGSEAKDSYLNIAKVIDAAKQCGAEAIHPGYGFLSENSIFAQEVINNGLVFIGPSARAIELSGDKVAAKEVARKLKIPTAPSAIIHEQGDKATSIIREFVKTTPYPILIKAAYGGGGKGIRKVYKEADLTESLASAQREALAFFGNGAVFVEKLIEEPKHIEVQIMGDNHGEVVHFATRDCSLQRRHQKLVEEAPACTIATSIIEELQKAAVAIGKEIKYQNAGTVEFLVDKDGHHYFLEVNSRLQVEHPVTEEVLGLDLVEVQIRVAAGQKLSQFDGGLANLSPRGNSFECRIYAEDPLNNFGASTGQIEHLKFKAQRVDSGFETGGQITHYYDSLIAKIIVSAPSRLQAISKMLEALDNVEVFGVRTNIGYLKSLLSNKGFQNGDYSINSADRLVPNDADKNLLAIHAAGLVETFDILSAEEKAIDAWNCGNFFRVNGQADHKARCSVNEIECQISLKRLNKDFVISTGQTEISLKDARVIDSSHLEYSFLDGNYKAKVVLLPSGRWVASHLGLFRVEPLGMTLKRNFANEASHSGDLSSPLPGKVVAIKAKKLSRVEAGQPLIIIESMKMEHIIKAPAAANVTEILVKENEIIESNRVLAKLEYF